MSSQVKRAKWGLAMVESAVGPTVGPPHGVGLDDIQRGPVVRVALDQLREPRALRLSGENLDHARALAEASVQLPPIIVHRPTMTVVDGLHRLRAAQLRGDADVAAWFFDGSEADAFVLAVRANIAHGLPLSLADRRAAAERIIVARPESSDRFVASATGLSPKTVAQVRRGVLGSTEEVRSRIGQDGRARPTDIARRREVAAALMLEDPEWSLRRVARAAGISPETARTVRNTLWPSGQETIAEPDDQGPPPRPVSVAVPRQRRRPAISARSGPDPMVMVRRLRSDPALRLSESGRILLRLLDVHVMSDDRWTSIIDAVPAHCRHVVAGVAAECAQAWATVAEQLRRDVDESA